MRMFFTVLLCLCLLASGALAEENRLEMAFGLFSVEIPAEAEIISINKAGLCDLSYEISTFPHRVNANFAPLDTYENTAARKLDSYISLLYALCGPGDYTETEMTEETLPNGVKLRWQLMQGSENHALWFEAFTTDFGYNVCLMGEATDEQDQAMLALMRSFRADAAREQSLLQVRQTKLADGAFISVEHGLQIQLGEEWNLVTMADMLRPDSAFILEKEGGRWLIQMMYTYPMAAEDSKALMDWYASIRKTYYGGTLGEPYTVTLENLGGIEAWVVDEVSGIYARNIAFVHEGYGYYGSFMWIQPDDDQARPFMEAAIHSLTKPE